MKELGPMRYARALLAAVALLACQALPALAQDRPNDNEPVVVPHRGFQLFGVSDFAITGLRQGGSSYWKTTASGPSDDAPTLNAGLSGRIIGVPSSPNGYCCGYFELQLWAAASRSDWSRNRDIAPSLENVKGGGYAGSLQLTRWGTTNTDLAWSGKDGSSGILFSGAQSTSDGSCRDNTGRVNAFVGAGFPLLAGSDCPPTWPVVNGTPTFLGEKPVPDTTFLRMFKQSPSSFNFDDWHIPNSQRPDKPIPYYGSFQTYGSTTDYGRERLQRFGGVTPKGSGPPLRDLQGYPLGIEWSWQVFTYQVPTIADAMFYKATVINRTADVYGVGLNYDSLYLGFMVRPFHTTGTQKPAVYAAPERGTVFSNQTNDNAASCYGSVHGTTDPNGWRGGITGSDAIRPCFSNTAVNRGFNGGAGALVILKSPIGDLRNKKFTDPSSPFYFPNHPLRGDTITYNQVNACGFSCASSDFTLVNDNARTKYGAMSNNEADVLGGIGKQSSDFTNIQYFDMFHTPDYPQRWSPSNPSVGGFARAVPRTADGTPWDYDHDGVPDTLKVLTCTGKTQATFACEKPWVDTLPGGFPNAVHNNYFAGVGPVKLKAGDSTTFVVAFVSSPDSVTVESQVNNYIQLYQNFWLSPEPPCPTNIVSATTVGGNRQYDTEVRLYFDQTVNQCQDKFLIEQAKILHASQLSKDVALKVFNQNLVLNLKSRAFPAGTAIADTVPKDTTTATVQACYGTAAPGQPYNGTIASCNIVKGVAQGVVDSLFIFKSCDNGNTYTASSGTACVPSPVRDITGAVPRFPWQAYARATRDANGMFPTSFRDGAVTGGVQYTYVVVGQSYAASFPVVIPSGGSLVPSTYTVRPLTLNGLTANTANRNVAVVYVPASRQAGADTAAITATGVTGLPNAARDTVAAFAAAARLSKPVRSKVPITTRVEFSDSAEVTIYDADTTVAGITSTTLKLFALADTGFTAAGAPKRYAYKVDTFTVSDSTAIDFASRQGTDTVINVPVGGGSKAKYTYIRFRGRGPQATLILNGRPAFVTDTFPSGNDITPPNTVASQSFPGFLFYFDPTRQRTLNSVNWYQPGVGALSSNAYPTLTWLPKTALDSAAYSRYVVTFADAEFGPGAPFTLRKLDPNALQNAYTNSLLARKSVAMTDTSPATAAVLSRQLKRTVSTSELASLALPFTIADQRIGQNVTVAVFKSAHAANVLLGNNQTVDTVRVSVPANEWIPGDPLYFIESFKTLVTDTVATSATTTGERVKINANGGVDSVTVTRVTWGPAVLGCGNVASCNPIEGVSGTGYTLVNPKEQLIVLYNSQTTDKIYGTSLFSINYTIKPSIAGTDVVALKPGDLSQVRAVPNPYVMYSAYEQVNNTKRLLFTHLPPRGTLRIYTASGQLVQQIVWTEGDLDRNCGATTATTVCVATGDLFWNMRTREDLEVGPGFYVFVVSSDIGGKKQQKIGKFVVIH